MDTPNPQSFEVHDPQALAQARAILDACQDMRDMQEAVIAAVRRNETWRGQLPSAHGYRQYCLSAIGYFNPV